MEIKDIYAFMDKAGQTSYDEISLEIDNVKLTLKKNVKSESTMPAGFTMPIIQMPGMSAAMPVQGMQTAPEPDGAGSAPVVDAGEKTSNEERSDLVAIKSPFVGTFYRAASPQDKPFVMVGQKVSKGDVVGIIEAMKLMNEITAPQDGIVESIEVQDGEMVDYNKNIVMLKIS